MSLEQVLDEYCPMDMPPEEWRYPMLSTLPVEIGEAYPQAQHQRRLDWHGGRLDDHSQNRAQPAQCLCGGTGWVSAHVAVRHPQFGKVLPCACERARQDGMLKDFRTRDSGLPVYTGMTNDRPTFSTYHVSRNPECSGGLMAAVEWAKGESTPWLMLHGPPGVGKTHLAQSAIWYLAQKGERAKFISAADFAGAARAAAADDAAAQQVSALMSVPWLAIDDLGHEHRTDFSTDRFYQLLNRRSDGQLRTLLTTNFNMDRLEGMYGAPIVSRILQGQVEQMHGDDQRAR
jgi:DNA replication protein DnaC